MHEFFPVSKTKMSLSRWPSRKFTSKVAEKVGYKVNGGDVTYQKYVSYTVDALASNQSTLPLQMSSAIDTMAEGYVKVGAYFCCYFAVVGCVH